MTSHEQKPDDNSHDDRSLNDKSSDAKPLDEQLLDADEIVAREKAVFRGLIHEIRGGDEDAAWRLLETYGPHIRAVVRRNMNAKMRQAYDSEDFVQSVWGSFLRIQDRLCELDSPKRFVGFLAAMARNKVVDVVRRQQPADSTRTEILNANHSDILRQAEDNTPTPSQFVMAREQWRKMVRLKSDVVRNVLQLRLQGLTYEEIATQLGVSERSARRHVKVLLAEWERMRLIRPTQPDKNTQDSDKLAG